MFYSSQIRGSAGAHLGLANIKEEFLGTEDDKIIVVQNPNTSNGVTILVRGSTDYVIEEAKRSIRDALCAVRNILTKNSIVYGGGSCEISTSVLGSKPRARVLKHRKRSGLLQMVLLRFPLCFLGIAASSQ